MTILVGVLCEDGVVIGSDSAISFSRGIHLPGTMERTDAIKVQVIGGKIVTAYTGEVGLGQRYLEQLKAMHGSNLLTKAKVMELATDIAERVINDFRRTGSVLQQRHDYGWGLGCLLGFPNGNVPELFEFDPIQFHPERVGDKGADGQPRRPRICSMGSAQALADPFLSFASGLIWAKDEAPKVADAKLVVAWTLQHTIRLNVGGVGGAIQLAAMERDGKDWIGRTVDTGEIETQIQELENHVRDYRKEMIAKAAAAPAPPQKQA